MTEPKAFLSHASEDKDRFVLPLGRALRAQGIDAWVDKWEMTGGDSLIQRIFQEGIAQAEAVIVVLPHVSVTKPWVRKELDAAVVRRVEQITRLIPIALDKDVEILVAIAHLYRYDVAKDGFDGVLDQLVRSLHGHSDKPPLGPPPLDGMASEQNIADASEGATDPETAAMLAGAEVERGRRRTTASSTPLEPIQSICPPDRLRVSLQRARRLTAQPVLLAIRVSLGNP